MNRRPIRVLVVDDSALARKIIQNSLAPFPDIAVVGTAMDPYVAKDKILQLAPDVITLDIEMPRMDGITFLKLIMKHRPLPVIILSSLSPSGSAKALEALAAGAIDVMAKPGSAYSADHDGMRLAEKIRTAAVARVQPVSLGSTNVTAQATGRAQPTGLTPSSATSARSMILLGASTGGTEALRMVLSSMRPDSPGICIAQHMPAYFSKAFAQRLNEVCPMQVREALHGDVVKPGLALVAPGGAHLVVKWRTSHHAVELNQGPPVHHQRPSVDILFDSVARAGSGPYTAAALLTGMGADGAAGLLHLRETGAVTIAQDEASCVVFGMPREAIRLGAAQHILSLTRIGPWLNRFNPLLTNLGF